MMPAAVGTGRAGSETIVRGRGTPPAPAADATGRIGSLDLLRGLALAGMILVHFHDHSVELAGLDDAIRSFIWRFVENKSRGTFSFLFGVGFAIQLLRVEARGGPFATIYLRRLAALAALGFVAHACFGFNVLLGYAVWGLPLLLIRRWSTRALIVAAIVCAASLSLYRLASALSDLVTLGADGAEAARASFEAGVRVNDALQAAVAQDSYAVLFAARLRHMAWFYTQPNFFMPFSIVFFIAGLLAVRHRLFENPWRHTRVILAMMVFGVASWLLENWILPLWTTPIGIPRISNQLHWLLGLFRDDWLTFTYVGAAILLLARYPQWLTRLELVGVAGRMALTNYLIQIAVLDLLFSGYGLHLGDMRPRMVPLAAALLFGAEVMFSRLWLERYRFGPAEWVWRSLAYGRVQKMRR